MALSAETQAALALVAAGVPAGAVADGVRLVDVVDTDTPELIAGKVDALKTRLPALFAEVSAPPLAGGLPQAGGPQPPSMLQVAEDLHSRRLITADQLAVAREKAGAKTALEVGMQIARDRYPQPPAA